VSPRTRIRLVVGGLALLAAAVVVGVVISGRGGGSSPERRPPALELSVLVRDDAEARALRAAERSYDSGNAQAARTQFASILHDDPASLEAGVGAAIAAWPDGTVDDLRRLAAEHPQSALVHLHLGLALYAAGEQDKATAEWEKAAQVEPDSPSAVHAGDLLHPGMAPGLPSFFTDLKPPKDLAGKNAEQQLDELRSDAQSGGGADEWILYGAALQRVGRPVSARAAFDRALELAPHRLDAKVAAAVGRFDKANPSAAFSRLGPLARDHPDAAVVRFHLGVLLLWIRDVKDARVQLQQAAGTLPESLYSREAKSLLSRLEGIGT
jgi:tetratricopeptide (TPR) repeat protein